VGALAAFTGLGPVIGASLIPLALGLLIAVITFIIRVLFTLARAYLLLLIYLIMAPFFIMWSILTGQGIWNGWLRGVIANLLVFPMVGIIIFLVNVLIQQINLATGAVWGPPYLGNQSTIIKAMISLGAIMLLPQVTTVINQMRSIRGLDLQLPGAGNQFRDFVGGMQRGVGPNGIQFRNPFGGGGAPPAQPAANP